MTQTLLKIVANFETTLASSIASGDTTATLVSATTKDGNTIPAGTYGFTIDEGTADEEHVVATVSGTALSAMLRGVSVEDGTTEITALKKAHRRGAKIKITNHPGLMRILRILDGTTDFDSGTPLKYDGNVTPTDANEFATKGYVDGASGNPTNYDQNIISGIAGETIASGEAVYLKTSDGRWYLTDASDSAKSQNVVTGIAQGAGVAAGVITDGVLVGGVDKKATYTAGAKYYLSDTPGALATSPGTFEVFVGEGDANNSLLWQHISNLETLTADEKDALAGTDGTPSASNKYVTNDDTSAIPSAGKVVRFNSNGQIDGGKFGGDGSDGALTVSSDTTLNPSYKTFNYTDVIIDDTFTLDFGSNFQNKVVYFKVQGDLEINGTLSLKGLGATGGDGGSGGEGSPAYEFGGSGDNGSAIHTDVLDSDNHRGVGGSGGDMNNGTYGGSTGGNGGAGGAVLVKTGIASIYATQKKKLIYVIPGAAGAGGAAGGNGNNSDIAGTGGSGGTITTPAGDGETSASKAGAGGAGGAGGGALVLEVAGNITFGANAVIDLDGQDGGNGGTGGGNTGGGGGGAGGGGGSAGMAIILYNGTLTDGGVDISVDGGSGGDGGAGGEGSGTTNNQGGGGAGAGGSAGFYSAAGESGGDGGNGTGNGTATGSAGTAGAGGAAETAGSNGGNATGNANGGGGAGGAGGSNGTYLIEQNENF